MAKDLVCGMDVDEGTNSAQYGGKTYSFCAEACREAFLKEPSKYLETDEDKGSCS